jgi:hypothetical protein
MMLTMLALACITLWLAPSVVTAYDYYEPPIKIYESSTGFLVFIACFSSVYGYVLTGMLYQIVKLRNHPVMQLAQAPFLAVQMVCSLLIVVSLFTFLPRDTFCSLQGLLNRVPATILAATLLGRIWRVYSVLSVSMGIGRGGTKLDKLSKGTLKTLSGISNVHHLLRCKCPKPINDGDALRIKVSGFDLARLVAVLTLPQFLVQLLTYFIDPVDVIALVGSDPTTGRYACEPHWSLEFGLYYQLILIFSSYTWRGFRGIYPLLSMKQRLFFDRAR